MACAIVAAEVRRIRQAEPPWRDKVDWPEETSIGDDGLGLDSLERLGALGALAETFGLDDGLLGEVPPQTVGDWIDWIMSGHARTGSRITVRTSGSTGDPRACAHATADLLDEAAVLATRFGDRQRVVALVPAHHLYGIVWTALLPAALDVPVVTRVIGAPLGLRPGDLVVAVPSQWEAILRLVPQLPDDIVGITSAGPLSEIVEMGVLAAGLSRLVDVYGSSETSAIAVREAPAKSYDVLPRWQLTTSHDDPQLLDMAGRVIPIPDRVERIGDRSLRPIGRRDGAVQIGGHNVWPDRVARVLCEVDGVAEATVRLSAQGRLKAFVVPDGDSVPDALAVRLERTVAARLTDAERPSCIRFGTELPRNAIGKLEDWA